MYADAASAYADALQDTSYGKQGALLTTQGKALSAAGDLNGAVQAFSTATRDASYATPYKAYLGLGNALLTLGNVTDAGVAFRAAAIDGTNPAPASALSSLGSCLAVPPTLSRHIAPPWITSGLMTIPVPLMPVSVSPSLQMVKSPMPSMRSRVLPQMACTS